MTDDLRRVVALPIHDGAVRSIAGCPRGRTDCTALGRYASPEYESFMCCGETDAAPVATDHLRLCIKAQHAHGVDIMVNLDERDAVHSAAVLLAGLSYRGSVGLTPMEVPQ